MKTIVIGGGAAGMMAAHFAAEKGDEVILIEKNEKLGKKIYITGKGRCNLTNDCEFDEFMNNVVNNGRFLMSSIRSFLPPITASAPLQISPSMMRSSHSALKNISTPLFKRNCSIS